MSTRPTREVLVRIEEEISKKQLRTIRWLWTKIETALNHLTEIKSEGLTNAKSYYQEN
jgi:hypothetical protein